MSSCKKWNSCNNNCKRSGGGRGGGNGVIGKDGAPGPRGPTGLQGPTGPAPTGLNGMIPYEPYNQNNAAHETEGRGSIQLKSNDTTTYIQFTAPSTGYYTKARMLTNGISGNPDISGSATIQVRMGVYDNSENYAPFLPVPPSGARGNQGIPYNILGQGVLDITPPHSNWSYRFLDISLNPPVHLKMNENYWFAYSTHNSVDLSSNIFTIANNYFFIPPSNQIQNGNVLSVLDISDNNTKGGPSGAGGGDASMNDITDLSGAPLQPSPNATWFRLYDPSASFIVGPQGPTGDCGCTGATGSAGPAFKSYDFGVHILPQNDNTTAQAPKVRLGLDSLSVMGGASRLSNAVISFVGGPIGWIYPSYGGYAQFGSALGQDISNVTILNQLNWSDRSSLPTGAWASKSSYSRPIGRTIDTDFTIDLDSEFSWVFGPYDGGNTVGGWAPTTVSPYTSNMNLYIVKIPQITYKPSGLPGGAPVPETLVPDASGNWKWIKLTFDPTYRPQPPPIPATQTAVGRCGSYTLRDMIAPFTHARPGLQSFGTGTYNQVGTPITSIWTGLKFVPGDTLGIFIGKQGMFYENKNLETNEFYLISPATFSLKVKQT